jgi:hypothetical protein
VSCSVSDAAHNTATASFVVRVQRCTWDGFRAPVDEVNIITAVQSLPLKFSMRGYYGMDIFSVTKTEVSCGTLSIDAGDVADLTTEAVANSSSYDAVADQYNFVFNAKASKVASKKCYKVTLATKYCPDKHSTFIKVK